MSTQKPLPAKSSAQGVKRLLLLAVSGSGWAWSRWLVLFQRYAEQQQRW